MSFVKRLINVGFGKGEGVFVDSGSNQLLVTGLRVSAKIIKAGGPSMGTASVQIWGMTNSTMNDLSTLGMRVRVVGRDTISISAGDADSGMAVVFQGTITNAWADFTSAPDVVFHIDAHIGLEQATMPADPTSFQGSVDVATIMAGLAAKMGVAFENNGVSIQLSNPYFPGNPRAQVMACAKAAGCKWALDDGKLVIWPSNGARDGQTPLVSPKTGMVGYPAFIAQGIMVRTIFNPSIGFGQKIQVQSDLQRATGTWAVFSLDHELESLMPHGQWFSILGCYNPTFEPPVRT